MVAACHGAIALHIDSSVDNGVDVGCRVGYIRIYPYISTDIPDISRCGSAENSAEG